MKINLVIKRLHFFRWFPTDISSRKNDITEKFNYLENGVSPITVSSPFISKYVTQNNLTNKTKK